MPADPPAMTFVDDLAAAVPVQDEATVSRTVLTSTGARVVVFSFDAGQELAEHTAAVPVLLQVLDGHLRITADGRTVNLHSGGLVHLGPRVPHAVDAVSPSRLVLTLLDGSR